MKVKLCFRLLLLGLGVTFVATQPGSCSGRCGEVFTRGQICTCDLSCLQHDECCPDFQDLCNPAKSCRGRCGEPYKRGQSCDCDPQCLRYNTCCHDYQLQCDTKAPQSAQAQRVTTTGKKKSIRNQKNSNSESEEMVTGKRLCQLRPGARCPSSSAVKPGGSSPAVPTNHLHGVNLAPGAVPIFPNYPQFPPSGSPLAGSTPVQPSGNGAFGGAGNAHLVITSGGLGAAAPGPIQGEAAVFRPRPDLLQDVAQILGFTVIQRVFERPGAEVLAGIDLCNDAPINGLTALHNGTILIFKGDYFWSVDPASRLVGLPQSITDTLGVPSPIDVVFTRFDCHKNTYIIKGDQIWRLDVNMVPEPGYPKPLSVEFPGLTGSISAALVVPATSSTPETVFFFKPGDMMQRFTFPPGNNPSCSKLPERFLFKQAEAPVSVEINITVALKDFPIPVTSALTLQATDRYEHYVFSGPLFFSVQISNNLPVLTKPGPAAVLAPLPILSPAVVLGSPAQSPAPPQPANSIRVWLRCI